MHKTMPKTIHTTMPNQFYCCETMEVHQMSTKCEVGHAVPNSLAWCDCESPEDRFQKSVVRWAIALITCHAKWAIHKTIHKTIYRTIHKTIYKTIHKNCSQDIPCKLGRRHLLRCVDGGVDQSKREHCVRQWFQDRRTTRRAQYEDMPSRPNIENTFDTRSWASLCDVQH